MIAAPWKHERSGEARCQSDVRKPFRAVLPFGCILAARNTALLIASARRSDRPKALRYVASKRELQGEFDELREPLFVVANETKTNYKVVIGRCASNPARNAYMFWLMEECTAAKDTRGPF